MIYDVKNYPIFKVSSQKPSMSFKSHMKQVNLIMKLNDMIYDAKDDPIFQVSSQ